MMEPIQEAGGRVGLLTQSELSSRFTNTEEGVQTDELIIDRDMVPLLQENLRRIEKTFSVKVELGMAVDELNKQWVSLQGLDEDRSVAKSYIKALCNPGKKLSYEFPPELQLVLSEPEVHAKLESQSNAAILFPSKGNAVIQGEDDLAVTLAMSALEDMIEKYHSDSVCDPASPDSARGEATDRLDRELRRLSSQSKDVYSDEFDVETLSSMSAPVKRTLLKYYMDNSKQGDDPDQTVPMQLAGPGIKTGFVDLHPKTNERKDRLEKDEVKLANRSSLSSQNSLSLSLSLGEGGDSITTTDRFTDMVFVDWANTKSMSSIDNHPVPTDVASVEHSPYSSLGTSLASEAITFARGRGYSEEEIKVVQEDFGNILTTAEFLRALSTNRMAKNAITVSELEAATIRRPAAKAETTNQTITTSEKKSPSGRSDSPDAPQGGGKAHIQGPKTKRGKHTKGTPSKQGKNTSQAARFSPTDENIDKIDVVTLSDEDHQASKSVTDVAGDSDLAKNRNTKSDDAALMDYLQQLSKDYEEEDSSDIEEVRRRNADRRAILKQAMDIANRTQKLQEGGDSDSGDDDVDSDEGKWVVASKLKHRSRSPGSHAKSTGKKSTNKLQPPVKGPSQSPSWQQTTTPMACDQSISKARTQLQFDAQASTGNNIDMLDDFSLPPSLTDHAIDIGVTSSQKADMQASQATNTERPGSDHPASCSGVSNCGPISNNQQQHRQRQLSTEQQQQQQQRQQQQQKMQPPSKGYAAAVRSSRDTGNLRYIVIDGSNVAMTHGNHTFFSCRGIRICIDYFKRRGHKEVTAFVPQWRTHAPRPDYPIRDQHLLEEMRREGVLVFTPARRVPGKSIVCYDDKFVLRLAQETEGIIVSNDNYRDLWKEKREWRQIIEQRLLMFSFVGDIFMPPDDPLGRDGPSLEDFLRKSNTYKAFLSRAPQQSFYPPTANNMPARPRHQFPAGNYQGSPGQMYGHSQPSRMGGPQRQPYMPGPRSGYMRAGQPGLEGTAQGHRPPNSPFGGPGARPPQAWPAEPGSTERPDRVTADRVPRDKPPDQKGRSGSTTEFLRRKLQTIFSDQGDQIDKVLSTYSSETDVNRLVEYMLEAD